jgi:hypothetical protein
VFVILPFPSKKPHLQLDMTEVQNVHSVSQATVKDKSDRSDREADTTGRHVSGIATSRDYLKSAVPKKQDPMNPDTHPTRNKETELSKSLPTEENLPSSPFLPFFPASNILERQLSLNCFPDSPNIATCGVGPG